MGEIAHSGVHGRCPHNIKVCVTKTDNVGLWDQLIALVGEKPILQHHKTSEEAPAIVEAIVRGADHPYISRIRDLVVINPKELFSDSSSKRLKKRIKTLMSQYPEFMEAKYRTMLAYRSRPILQLIDSHCSQTNSMCSEGVT